MNFLHSWAIAMGAGAVGLPVLIHWLTRPRPFRLPLSTLRFVREVIHQRRALHRLRNILILLLRTAAVLLLAWAFSRPLIGDRPLLSDDDTIDASRVVILDVSQSMAASTHGIELFERARPLAAKHLTYRSGLRANLILAGARPRLVFDRYSSNFAALHEELARAGPRPERLDIAQAIEAAAEMLAQAPSDDGQRRELVVVSDFQRSNWASADFSPLPEDTLIQLEAVAPAEAPPNLALLRVGSQGRAERGREVRVEVEVGNYAPTPRQVRVELEVGEASYRIEGLCPPGGTTTLSQEVVVRDAGWQLGRARLLGVEDALAADDARPFVINVHPKPIYALITRQSPDARPSSSYFLARALVPFEPHDDRSSEKLVRVDPAHLTREVLTPADLIVVDHPGKLSTDAVNLLAGLLRRGRSILYVTAEPVDATNLRLLVDAAGSDLQMPVEFMPPPAGRSRRDLFIPEVNAANPPFNVFGDQLSAVIGPLRFSGGLTSRQLDSGLADDQLATYNDRSACLVVTACRAGSLAVLNADLGTSNLPRGHAFVPLLGELLGHLLGQRRISEAVGCGEPSGPHPLPADAGTTYGLTVVGPESAGDELGELVEEASWISWRCGSVAAPGIYRVARDDTTLFALAAAVPADEADLAALDAPVLEDRLAGGREVHYHSATADDEGKDDFWTWVLVACVGCMLLELLALKVLRT